MTRLIDRRTRLMFETPFLIGKRPLIAAIEPWGLRLREKGRRGSDLPMTWAQVWNRAAMIAAPGSSGNQQGGFNNEKDIQKGESSSMSVNRVILIGRVGKDPEVKYAASDMPICRFPLATNERFKDKAGERQEHTEWHSIVAWGRLAEICGQYLTKAKLVYIEGTIRTRKWDDKDGKERKSFDIVANQMRMLSSSNGDGTKSKAESAKPAPPIGASQTTAQPSYEDNPFEADPSDVPF